MSEWTEYEDNDQSTWPPVGVKVELIRGCYDSWFRMTGFVVWDGDVGASFGSGIADYPLPGMTPPIPLADDGDNRWWRRLDVGS